MTRKKINDSSGVRDALAGIMHVAQTPLLPFEAKVKIIL